MFIPPILLLALAAAAPDDTITVTGTRLTDKQIAVGARNYVGAVLPIPAYGQYSRWADPVCIKVTGLEDAYAARVAAAADEAHIARARPGCRTNLSIVFSEDAVITTAAILAKKPKQIARLDGTERHRLLTARLPVRFWHVLELRGADGRAPAPSQITVAGSAPQTDSWSASLIDTHIAIWATSAVVIVDVGLSSGKSLDAVADYAALVGLAPMRLPPPTPGVPSFLALFTPASADALSSWDKAFLAALYRMQMNRTGSRQEGQLVTAIKAELAR
ncbi:hypothetical protein GCM10011529_23890 [Polymorphobacter glacialis]|uniref:Uncharacterized protein n=1 Tax=Sandarakinorhabdus glacialis TaxID=1614636 RepID=A0A917E9P1_9SPHN|nr:hypothetical protein [Polymorphobacter glacialis]GGE16651.1 hypothetical protein GCM10011529_23890 [Polymorphobacter glacialis]